MKYVIDIDGTICKEVIIPDSGGKKDYANHIPMPERIAKVNALYDQQGLNDLEQSLMDDIGIGTGSGSSISNPTIDTLVEKYSK